MQQACSPKPQSKFPRPGPKTYPQHSHTHLLQAALQLCCLRPGGIHVALHRGDLTLQHKHGVTQSGACRGGQEAGGEGRRKGRREGQGGGGVKGNRNAGESTRASSQAASYAVQCSAVQCSAVQCSAVQCSAVQCSASTSGRPSLQALTLPALLLQLAGQLLGVALDSRQVPPQRFCLGLSGLQGRHLLADCLRLALAPLGSRQLAAQVVSLLALLLHGAQDVVLALDVTPVNLQMGETIGRESLKGSRGWGR